MPAERVSQDDIMRFVRDLLIVSTTMVAMHYGIHPHTARRKLGGLVAQGKLIRDEYNADGTKARWEHWRYGLKEE